MTQAAFGFGGVGVSVGRTLPVFPDEVVRWMGTIFSGAFVPVIPLLQNFFETSEETCEPM